MSPIYFATNGLPAATGFAYETPFNPVRKLIQTTSWQVNDPLVHYLTAHLKDITNNSVIQVVRPTDQLITNSNLGRLNDRFRPWGGNPLRDSALDPNASSVAVKDAGIWNSDFWNFPTNLLLSPGSLGRVHRGTPWQTIHLKSPIAARLRWQQYWPDIRSHPTNDWRLAALLLSLLPTNDPRSLLSINQPDQAAWTRVLHGMTVLSNAPVQLEFPQFVSLMMESNSPQAQIIAEGITRSRQLIGHFRSIGDILATPELSVASPWLNRSSTLEIQYGLTDEAYEKIPEQLLPLLKSDPFLSLKWIDGRWQIEVKAFTGQSYALQASPDLQNWETIATAFSPIDEFQVVDPAAISSGLRFYRLILLP